MRDLSAAIRNLPPAEHEYDWLPMHMPGSVQAYGVLVIADARTRRVLFVSDNAQEMLGIPAADLLNKSYLALSDLEQERRFMAEKIGPDTILFPNPVRITVRGRAYDAVFHSHAETHQIEIEPVLPGAGEYEEMSRRAAEDLYDPPTVDELYQRAVKTIKSVSGFDRVMLYRLDARHNGQVIAEASREGIGSFLGLFFPSSDLGARVRDLYFKNFTRYIPDISAAAHPLSSVFPGGGRADSGHPVDMSYINLRSVYPCHVTYLQNIGVKASMSFSINVDGKLWGLFACHHYAPRLVSFDQRVVCEQTAMMFIYRLVTMSSSAARMAQRQRQLAALTDSLGVAAGLRRRMADADADWRGTPKAKTARAMLSAAIRAVEAETSFLLCSEPPPPTPADAVVTDAQQALLDLVEADSAAVVRHGRISRIGDAPPEMAVFAIASMFGRELPDLLGGELHLYATDCLAVQVPVAEPVKDRAAGILAVALSLTAPAYLIWFRREQVTHATWAGNPSADALSAGADGQNPRASFEAWKQDIRDLSRPWAIEDARIADELATVLREIDTGPERSDSTPRLAPAAPLPMAVHMPVPASAPQRRVIRIGQR